MIYPQAKGKLIMRNQKGQLRLRLPFEREEETRVMASSRCARIVVLDALYLNDGYDLGRCQGFEKIHGQFFLNTWNIRVQ